MADKKISALTSLAQGDIATTTDVLAIVDTSATETKKATPAAIVGAAAAAGLTNVDINSGAIDGTTIGANSAAAGTFTNLTASGTVSFSGATVSNGGSVTTVDINGGTIDGASVGASSASTGSFTTLTTSSTVTLNGGTANGVLYLNGSKVATSGSVVTFDGAKFAMGSAASHQQFDINLSAGGPSWNFGYIRLGSSAGDMLTWGGGASAYADVVTLKNPTNNPLVFGVNNTEQMRLTSTGLGIGTSSPAYKLTVQSAIDTYAFNIRDTIGNERVLIGSRSTAPIDNITPVQMGNDNAGNLFLSSRTNFASGINFYTNAGTAAVLRATLDSSGNLGLGVTPSAWGSSQKGFQLGNFASVWTDENGATGSIGANVYQSANSTWRYVFSGVPASRYTQGGTHAWYTAPSGTAGNAISFTQALTLDANVNLLLNGTTAPASGVGTFAIFNGTAPTGSVTNGCVLYAEDVSSSSELKVRDEAGNVTTLSPHNFSLIPEGASEDMAWAYYSEKGGKRINVDMLKLARMVEKLTGEKLVWEA